MRAADPAFGVRDLGALAARARGFALEEDLSGAEEGDRILVLRRA